MISSHRNSKGSLRIRRPQCSLVGAHLTFSRASQLLA